jgi:HEAT repeat protein
MKRLRTIGLCLPVLAVASCAQDLAVIKGPYVQHTTTNSAVIMCETNTPVEAEVEYGPTEAYGARARQEGERRIHEITLTGLRADTVYHYRVTTGEQTLPGSTVRTAPAEPKDCTFIAYGDSRSNPGPHSKNVANMMRFHPAFVINTGDLVSDGNVYEQWGPQYFGPLQPLIRSTPIYNCLGNHERNSEHYYGFFSYPGKEAWYSFDWGDAHFIALDSTDDNGGYEPGSEQHQWLEDDLKKCTKTWRLVFFHHPGYTTGRPGSGDSIREHLAPLFEEYDVDVVFNGHDHIYERSFAMRAGRRNQHGPTWIVTGGGGASTYSVSPDRFTQHARAVHHICVCEFSDAQKTLHVTAVQADGAILDELRLSKNPRDLMALRDQLAQAGGEARAAIVRRIAARSRPDGSPLLSPLLQDEDPQVRRLAVRGLGNTGDPKAAAPLEPLLADADADLRAEAAWAWLKTISAGVPERFAALSNDPDPRVRYVAANAMKQFPHAANLPALRRALSDEDPMLRRELAFALGRIGGAEVLPDLARAVRDPDADVADAAVDSLEEFDPLAEAVPALLEATAHDSNRVRRYACYALAEAEDRRASARLVELLADRDERVQQAAHGALKRISGEDLPAEQDAWREWLAGQE